MSPNERFTLSPITPTDYSALAQISILAGLRDPLHYLTYPPNVSHEEIVQYTLDTKIKFENEAKDVQTMKIVDNESPRNEIVGFASWFLGPRPKIVAAQRPHGASFKFLGDLERQVSTVAKSIYDEGKYIELNLMRILPSYQSKGLGTLLLDWGLKKARQEGKGIFVLAGPETQEMFLINGFEVKADVRMNLADYGANGVFVESVMVWDRSM